MSVKSRKKKILYLMHIDWNWIKQRPHFLAEGLNSVHDVLVLYHYQSDRSVLVRNTTAVRRFPIPRIPLGRFKLIADASKAFQKLFFKALMKIYNPDIVWITFPTLFAHLAECNLRNRTLIYDCMDDAIEFIQEDDFKKKIYAAEQIVLAKADMVLASSQNLMDKLTDRGCAPHKLALVRNAFDRNTLIEIVNNCSTKEPKPEHNLRICYIGTISDYVDLETIMFCIQNLTSVEFHFFGPVVCKIPSHERLVFHGAVNHEELAAIVQQYDALILPFKVNELIRGVDPVKLYEYINFNKRIFSVYYDEIRRFEDFVTFYRDKEELVQVIRQAGADVMKYSLEDRNEFLKCNSWTERVSSICGLLDQKLI